MADPVSWLMIGATVLSATGSITGGINANNAAKYNAAQTEMAGGQAMAASERSAYQARRQGNLTASRAQAVAAGSGATATDPTVIDLIGGINAQADYNAMTALYEGQSAQRDANAQAAMDRFEGSQAQTAGFLKAGTTLLQGGSSMYDRFGGGGFAKYSPKSGTWTPGPEGFPSSGYG